MSTSPFRFVLHGVLPVIVGVVAAKLTVSPVVAAKAAVTRGPAAPSAPGARSSHAPGGGGSMLSEQQAFCEKLRGASMDQLKEHLAEANKQTDVFRRRWARELVMEQMARVDPLAAVEFLKTWEDGGYRRYFLTAWARLDVTAAVAWTQAQGKDAKDLTYELIRSLVPDNLEAYVKILPSLTPEQTPSDQTGAAFRLLAQEDAANALKMVSILPAGGKQNTALNAVGEGWARREPKVAWDWAQTLKDPAARESALRGVLTAWCESDPAGAAAKYSELPGKEIKGEDGKDLVKGYPPLKAITRAWATLDARAAAAWIRSLPEGTASQFSDLLRSEILPTRDVWDPVELTEIIRKPGGEPLPEDWKMAYNSNSMSNFGDGEMITLTGSYGGSDSPLRNERAWEGEGGSLFAVEDPAKAFDAVAKMPGDASRQHMLQELANQWASANPQAAVARLKELTDPLLKLSLMNALSNEANRRADPDMDAKVVAASPPELAEHQFSGGAWAIYERIVATDPDRAASMLQGDLSDAARRSLAAGLAARQAEYDPQGAIAWANQQPTQEARSVAVASAMQKWAQADGFAASEWLAAQPANAERDMAIDGLINQLQSTSVEDAFEWSKAISDPTSRQLRQQVIIQSGAWRTPAVARQLLQSAGFPDDLRKRLEAQISAAESNR